MRFEDLNLLFHLCVRAAGMRFALGDALRNMDGETSMMTRCALLGASNRLALRRRRSSSMLRRLMVENSKTKKTSGNNSKAISFV